MKKIFCILLTGIFLLTGFGLPLSAGISGHAETVEEYLPEEPAPEENKTPVSSFAKGYVSVTSGTYAYRDRELTVPAGFFISSGNVYAQAETDTVLKIVIPNGDERAVLSVYIALDQVTLMPSGASTAMRNALSNSNISSYNGYPLVKIAFKRVEASAEPVQPAAAKTEPAPSDETAGEPEDGQTDETEPAVPEEGAPEAPETADTDWITAPADFSVSLSEDQQRAVLTWTGNGAAEQYAVFEKMDGYDQLVDTVTGAETYTTAALTEGEHTFYVIPQNGIALGMASAPVSILIEASWQAPVTGLAAVLSEDGTQAVLTWTGNGIAAGYSVYEQQTDTNDFLGTAADGSGFTTPALAPGEHTFLVRPCQDDAYGTPSEPVTITVPVSWKTAPTGLTAELSEDGTQAVLAWTGNGVASTYRIYEKVNGKNKYVGTATDAETFTTKALAPGEHTFLVVARQDDVNGIYSDTAAVTVPLHWKAAPTNVNVELSEDGMKAVLTWTGNGLATTYRIYEKIEKKNTYVGTATDAETFTTKTLAPGEHTYLVVARQDGVNGIYSAPVTVTVPMHWKAAPTNVNVELSEDGMKAVLTWTGNGLATAYRVYEKGEKKNTYLGTATDAETFTTKTLAPGEHTFFVLARQDGVSGLYSDTVTVTVPMHWKAAPTNVNVELSEDGTKAILTWTGNGLATAYRVYEKGEEKNTYLGTATDAETFTTKELEPGEHTFFVLPRMEKTNGLASETVSVLVP